MKSYKPTIIEMNKLNKDIISPETYLELKAEKCRNIIKATPFVSELYNDSKK